MRHLWLIFSKVATIGLAMWFIVTVLKPDGATRRASRTPAVRTVTSTIPELGEAVGIESTSYRDAAERAMPSVVNVFVTKDAKQPKNSYPDGPLFRESFGGRFVDREKRQFSLGSGVVVSSLGYILTNNHVVANAIEIEVALADGRKAIATLVGADSEVDLAVLKVDLQDMRAIALGNIEQTKVGDAVLAIGNPFGVGESVTKGIVSALGRNHLGISAFENFIQTDAAINPGNSGGALVDINGSLLGINTLIYSHSGDSLGIGFAIPVSTVRTVVDSIIKSGQVERGWIGVEALDITAEMAVSVGLKRSSGIVVAGVLKGGSADHAGVRPGDVLIAVDGKTVTDSRATLDLITQLPPGGKAELLVLRKSQELTRDVTVGKRPKMKREDNELATNGIRHFSLKAPTI